MLTHTFSILLLQYNVVINAWAKSGGKGAESEAEIATEVSCSSSSRLSSRSKSSSTSAGSSTIQESSSASNRSIVKEKMLKASSSDTVRSRSRTGKHSRQLVSEWTKAWEADGAPEPLPLPLQPMVAEPALAKVNKLAEGGHEGAKELSTYWVGQGVGLMNQTISASDVVQAFKEDFIKAYER